MPPSRRLIRKVLAYVLRVGDFLTFTQPEHPEAGLQVPGGTVLAGEPCDRAVLRELAEESGLSLERPRFVGLQYHDMAAYRPEIQERFVYGLEAPPGLPPSWLHLETRGGPRPVEFAFCWTPSAAAGGLIAGQGALLAQAPPPRRGSRLRSGGRDGWGTLYEGVDSLVASLESRGFSPEAREAGVEAPGEPSPGPGGPAANAGRRPAAAALYADVVRLRRGKVTLRVAGYPFVTLLAGPLGGSEATALGLRRRRWDLDALRAAYEEDCRRTGRESLADR